jgi:hypothetical protein
MARTVNLGDGIKVIYDRDDQLLTVTGVSWMSAHDPSRNAEVVGCNPTGEVFIRIAPAEQYNMCNRRFC